MVVRGVKKSTRHGRSVLSWRELGKHSLSFRFRIICVDRTRALVFPAEGAWRKLPT